MFTYLTEFVPNKLRSREMIYPNWIKWNFDKKELKELESN